MIDKIISELPKNRSGWVIWDEVNGMNLKLLYKNVEYTVSVEDVYMNKGVKYIVVRYDGVVYKEKGIQCASFINCNFGGILGKTTLSRNQFEYSEENKCWFGYGISKKYGDFKFAFDGDDSVIDNIKSKTWKISGNRIMCSKTNEALHHLVYGSRNYKESTVRHISNDLNLLEPWYDNRLCNLREVEFNKNSSRERATSKKYTYKYEISECGLYITIYLDGDSFIIDNNIEVINMVDSSKCSIWEYKGKKYIDCNIEGYIIKLHRLLFGLTDSKYREFHIDHINGDGLDNRKSNMVITDSYGNMCNVKGKGYVKTKSGTYQVYGLMNYRDEALFRNGVRKPTYKTEVEAINELERRREYVMRNRLELNSKDELDEYILKQKLK